jgi:serine/threonine protein kinase
MGVVWRVRQVQTRQLFALKTLRDTATHGTKVIRRLLHEARATAAVKSRHVVRIVDVEPAYVHEGYKLPYIVMELLEGESLSTYLDRVHTITPAQLVWLLRQVSRALFLAHARGIVHRDLKPSNVFLAVDDDGNTVIKVCDFGIAKLQGAAIIDLAETGTLTTATGELLGTPRYMAPEQLKRGAVEGPATDQWAFALIAFRALTGHGFFEQATNVAELVLAIVHDALPVPSTLSEHFPASLDGWFARSCARDPGSRFLDIGEQQAELERQLGCSSVIPIGTDELRVRAQLDYLTPRNSRGFGSGSLQASIAQPRKRWVRQYTFYSCLIGSTVFALAGAKWTANALQRNVNASTVHTTTKQTIEAMIVRAVPSSTPTSATTAPESSTEGTVAMSAASAPESLAPAASPNQKSRHQAQRRRNSGLLTHGSQCTRSVQCESGMCAAEVCQ